MKLKSNRYWRVLCAGGFVCDNCGVMTNNYNCMRNRKSGKQLCRLCYRELIKKERRGKSEGGRRC